MIGSGPRHRPRLPPACSPSPLRGGGWGERSRRPAAASVDLSPPAPLSEAERAEKYPRPPTSPLMRRLWLLLFIALPARADDKPGQLRPRRPADPRQELLRLPRPRRQGPQGEAAPGRRGVRQGRHRPRRAGRQRPGQAHHRRGRRPHAAGQGRQRPPARAGRGPDAMGEAGGEVGPALGVREARPARRCRTSSSPTGRGTRSTASSSPAWRRRACNPSPEADRYTLARRVCPRPDRPAARRRSWSTSSSPTGRPRRTSTSSIELLTSPGLRRALGPHVARPGPLRRHQGVREGPRPDHLAVPRLGDRRVQRATCPTTGSPASSSPATCCPDATPDQLLATAFHRNTMTNDEGGTDDEEFRVAAVKDRVDTTIQVWMGLTMGCAKCHSHKYDPISQKEYYQLYAFFNQTEDADTAGRAARTFPTPTRAAAGADRQAPGRVTCTSGPSCTRTPTSSRRPPPSGRSRRASARGWTAVKPTAMTAASGSKLKIARRRLGPGRGPPAGPRDVHGHPPRRDRAGSPASGSRCCRTSRTRRAASGRDGERRQLRPLPVRGQGEGEGREATDLPSRRATADFSQDQYPVEHALKNPDPKKHGWAVAPKQLEIHQAVFLLAEPFTPAAGTELEVTLDHQFEFTYPGFSLGRFRLFLTGDESPSARRRAAGRAEGRPPRCRPEQRTAEQQAARLGVLRRPWPPTRKPLRDKLPALEKEIEAVPVPQTPIMRDLPAGKQRATKVHVRGNFLDQGEPVEPGGAGRVPPVPGGRPEEPPRAGARGSWPRTTR